MEFNSLDVMGLLTSFDLPYSDQQQEMDFIFSREGYTQLNKGPTFSFLEDILISLRPIKCIFAYLVLANSKLLLFKEIPQMIVWAPFRNFTNLCVDYVGCKLVIYLFNVSRSVSLSITCLLSGFQVITISPRNSWWAELKLQTPKYIVPSCFLCWCFYLLINFTLLGATHNSRYVTNNTEMWNLGYCSILNPTSFNAVLFAIIFSIPDVMCLGVMIWASAYIMLLLHRHHQQVQHIHASHFSTRTFPEKRATHGILLLVSAYASFYSMNSILSLYLFKIEKHNPWLLTVSSLLAAWFPAISPFVLIFCDSQVRKHWNALWHRRHSKQHFPQPYHLSTCCPNTVTRK
ncbi:vomeronasal type-1 receptor 4-like [Dromiciops gliroides]|uniref:vomeronasal type-1 receptor 4-like n=1 Tax=Dromiciops gliroides TaxID=33562 RepID=UPI001CC3C142|nr:vomeronasal type-1 receptor 4-like [Dromiciops gliroides]